MMKRSGPPKRKTRLKRESKRRPTVKDLDKIVREIVMLRDGNKCQLAAAGMGPCGGHLAACHILGKGAYPRLRHVPLNVIAGCWRHHDARSPVSWHSNPMIYGLWFEKAYGTRWAELEVLRQTMAKRNPDLIRADLIAELEAMTARRVTPRSGR